MIASRCRSDLTPDCTTSPPFGVNGSRKNGFVVTVSTRASAGAFISVGSARRTLVSRQLRFWLVHRPPGLTVRRPRVLLVQPPRARPRPSQQLRVLPVRKPPSSRPWQLLALPPWPLRARPCGRLHARPSPPPRVARVRQPRSSLSQRLRALPASPPRARLFAQRRAPPSRQLYASLARWLRASPSLLPCASPAAQLRAGISPRRQVLLARLRLRDPWPLAWPF